MEGTYGKKEAYVESDLYLRIAPPSLVTLDEAQGIFGGLVVLLQRG